jgi:hypothetical protein
MNKKYLKSIIAAGFISYAAPYPNIQVGLGLSLNQSILNLDYTVISDDVGVSLMLPELNISASAIQSINETLAISLDTKVSASLLSSTYLGIRTHLGDLSSHTLNLGLGITATSLPDSLDLPEGHQTLPATIDGNFIFPTFSAGITTLFSPNLYTSFEVFVNSSVRLSENIHVNSMSPMYSEANKLLEFTTLTQGGVNLSIGYAL